MDKFSAEQPETIQFSTCSAGNLVVPSARMSKDVVKDVLINALKHPYIHLPVYPNVCLPPSFYCSSMSMFLCIYLSYICLPVNQFVYTSLHWSIHLSIHSSVYFFHLSINSSVHPATCLPVCLSILPSIFFYICLSICLFYIHLSINQSINLSIHPAVCLSVSLSIHPSFHLLLYISIHPSICQFFHPPINMSVYPSFNLSVYNYSFIHLFVFPPEPLLHMQYLYCNLFFMRQSCYFVYFSVIIAFL